MTAAPREAGVRGHLREPSAALVIAQQLEREGDADVLAVGVIRRRGAEVAVGDRALLVVRTEVFGRALDRQVDFRVLDAVLLGQG